jgi:hypothetical protein
VDYLTDEQIADQLRGICEKSADGLAGAFLDLTDIEDLDTGSRFDVANLLAWINSFAQAIITICPEYWTAWQDLNEQLSSALDGIPLP